MSKHLSVHQSLSRTVSTLMYACLINFPAGRSMTEDPSTSPRELSTYVERVWAPHLILEFQFLVESNVRSLRGSSELETRN
jgi:hypothetical protein